MTAVILLVSLAWVPPGFCDWARGFVERYGRERTIEIARLKHTEAEIEATRRMCFPDEKPIRRREGR